MLALLAQAAEGGGSTDTDWIGLAQYGVLGLVVLGFIVGKIVPGYIYERRVAEHAAEKEENRRLEGTIKDRVIPALVQSSDVLTRVMAYLDRLDERPPPRRRT